MCIRDRSIFEAGIAAARALLMAVRSWKLPVGSFPARAATMMSRPRRVNSAPRLESTTALVRLICDHLLWPAIGAKQGCQVSGGYSGLVNLVALTGGVEHHLGS